MSDQNTNDPYLRKACDEVVDAVVNDGMHVAREKAERALKNLPSPDWDKNDIDVTEIVFWGPYSLLRDGEQVGNDGGMVIRWQKPNCGFGEVTFFMKDGQLHCDTESMTRRFVMQVLEKALASAKCDIDERPKESGETGTAHAN